MGDLPCSLLLQCDVFGDASKKLHTTLAMGMTRGGAGGGVYPAQSCCGVMCLAMPARKFYTKLAMGMTRVGGGGGSTLLNPASV